MNYKNYNLSFTTNNNKKNKRNELLAGEWCLDQTSTKIENNSKNLNISDKENNQNIFNEAKFCENLYNRLLEDLIIHLNQNDKFKWNKRSWEIFLGPWLNRYVTIIYDRYSVINYVLKKYKINSVKLIRDKRFNLLQQNLLDFRIISQEDDWNLKLFSKLYLNYFDNKKIKKIFLKSKSSNKIFGEEKTIKIKFWKLKFNYLINYLIKKYNSLFNLIFYKTSINNKKSIFLLLLIKKKLFFPYNFNFKLPKIIYLSKKRNKKIYSKFKLTKVEIILREMLFELMPYYYLESIKNLKYLNKNLILPPEKNVKIFTSNSLWLDGIFKFWLANAISKNSKLNCFQHGCNYGVTKYSYAEKTEIKLSNSFYTWGWNNNKKNVKNFFSIRSLFQKEFKKNKTNKILVVLSNCFKYVSYHNTGTFSSRRSLIYFDLIQKICAGSFNDYKIYLRSPPHDKISFNIEKKIKKLFRQVKFDEGNKNFIDACNNYKLILHTKDSTGFLETLALNKPTMLILPKKIYQNNFRKSALQDYKDLEKVNIVFNSFDKFNNFIKQKNFDIDTWWNAKKTQKVKNLFCNKYCRRTGSPLKEIYKII